MCNGRETESATSAFRGGAGAIRTDITVTTIIHTIIMDTAGTVTTTVPVMDTTMATDQGIFGGCGVGDKRGLRFREDVNANGVISSVDVALVKSKVGTALPP